MFKKYGEFDSAEEMNSMAAERLKENDTKTIYGIAEETVLIKKMQKITSTAAHQNLSHRLWRPEGSWKWKVKIWKSKEF